MTRDQRIYLAASVLALPIGLVIVMVAGPPVMVWLFLREWWAQYQLKGIRVIPREELLRIKRSAMEN